MKAKLAQKNVKTKNLGQQGRRSSNQKGLLNKIVRGSKGQKGKNLPFKLYYNFGVAPNHQVARRNRFVLIALGRARLSARQIEAGRRAIKKFIRKSYRLSVQVYPFSPVTKRPSDVRMGKGKGTKISDWIYPLKSGKILYEIMVKRRRRTFRRQAFYQISLVRALRFAQTKFSFPTVIRQLRE
jgi:ribosomal protein L16